MGSVKKPASGAEAKVKPALSMSDDVLEDGKIDVRVTTAAYPILPVKGMRTDSHKKPRKGDLTRSMALAATSSTAGASSSSSLDMQVCECNLSWVHEGYANNLSYQYPLLLLTNW
jgi:hypothetical protein